LKRGHRRRGEGEKKSDLEGGARKSGWRKPKDSSRIRAKKMI